MKKNFTLCGHILGAFITPIVIDFIFTMLNLLIGEYGYDFSGGIYVILHYVLVILCSYGIIKKYFITQEKNHNTLVYSAVQ